GRDPNGLRRGPFFRPPGPRVGPLGCSCLLAPRPEEWGGQNPGGPPGGSRGGGERRRERTRAPPSAPPPTPTAAAPPPLRRGRRAGGAPCRGRAPATPHPRRGGARRAWRVPTHRCDRRW